MSAIAYKSHIVNYPLALKVHATSIPVELRVIGCRVRLVLSETNHVRVFVDFRIDDHCDEATRAICHPFSRLYHNSVYSDRLTRP